MSLVQIDGQAQKCHVHENTVKFESLQFILFSVAYLRYNCILSFPMAVLMSQCTLPLVFCAILGKHNCGQEVGIS